MQTATQETTMDPQQALELYRTDPAALRAHVVHVARTQQRAEMAALFRLIRTGARRVLQPRMAGRRPAPAAT